MGGFFLAILFFSFSSSVFLSFHDLAGGLIFAHLEFFRGGVYIPAEWTAWGIIKKAGYNIWNGGDISKLQTRLLMVGKGGGGGYLGCFGIATLIYNASLGEVYPLTHITIYLYHTSSQ